MSDFMLDLPFGVARRSALSSLSMLKFKASNCLARLEELPVLTKLLGAALFLGVEGLLGARVDFVGDDDDDASTDFFKDLSVSSMARGWA
jgi:hypothetical protein